jgi:hypothetical protein
MRALNIVDDAVNRKIGNYCYPIMQGTPSAYQQVWGFKSLLGAMWDGNNDAHNAQHNARVNNECRCFLCPGKVIPPWAWKVHQAKQRQ